MSSEYSGFYFKNYEIKRCCHFLVNKCKIFKMLIETLFFRLFEPDQSEIKEIVQEIVNIHKGAIFKNGTWSLSEIEVLPLPPMTESKADYAVLKTAFFRDRSWIPSYLTSIRSSFHDFQKVCLC